MQCFASFCKSIGRDPRVPSAIVFAIDIPKYNEEGYPVRKATYKKMIRQEVMKDLSIKNSPQLEEFLRLSFRPALD